MQEAMNEIQNLSTRQQAIKDLIAKESISDQNQIVQLLKEKYGIETTQAVISRDLRKLKVVKRLDHDVMVYEMPNLDIGTKIIKLSLIDIEHNETLIVIKVQPGLAAFVGDCLDQNPDLDILGCIAGENTVIIIPKSIHQIGKTYQAICQNFQFIPKRIEKSDFGLKKQGEPHV